MDFAQQIELRAKRYHQAVDDLIDHGDSAVQKYYEDTTVFVTGGSGFLGKQLIEKLLRSCAIKIIYLLTRSKKGKTIQQRLDQMLTEPIFDRLREKQPQFASKIIPVEGDVADIRLGLSEKDWAMLGDEVEIIFHEAATVRFDEPLAKAVFTNVRGTREALTLGKQCRKLKKFVHVSTIFCHATIDRIDGVMCEEFYPSPVPPHTIIELAEEVDSSKLDSITKDLIKGWPNTYTFTKAITEELIRISASELPVCIVRPSIVLPALFEPNPGWLDTHTVLGPSGIYLGSALGVIRVMLTDTNASNAMVPVDYVNNVTIAAPWDSTERQKTGQKGICIYNASRNLHIGKICEVLRKHRHEFNSPRAIWYADAFEAKSRTLYFVMSWFYHYIPAYFVDFVCKILGIKLPHGITSFVDIYRKLDKLMDIYNYFIFNEWKFTDDNLRDMIERMSEADRLIFNCDLSNIDFEEYILVWGIGLKRYIVKDELVGTAAASRKQRILWIVHYVVLTIYIYILWYIFSTVLKLLKYFLSCIF